jgi:hypothetical protein
MIETHPNKFTELIEAGGQPALIPKNIAVIMDGLTSLAMDFGIAMEAAEMPVESLFEDD